MVLSSFSLLDQWKNPVNWNVCTQQSCVLIFAGKDAAEEGREWGKKLNEKFNPGFQPTKDHLQTTTSSEVIKLVAVISLPDVPTIFKSFFYGGFRKHSPTMGVALDFGETLSKAFNYDRNDKIPAITVLGKNDSQTFRGLSSDGKSWSLVTSAISKELKTFRVENRK